LGERRKKRGSVSEDEAGGGEEGKKKGKGKKKKSTTHPSLPSLVYLLALPISAFGEVQSEGRERKEGKES